MAMACGELSVEVLISRHNITAHPSAARIEGVNSRSSSFDCSSGVVAKPSPSSSSSTQRTTCAVQRLRTFSLQFLQRLLFLVVEYSLLLEVCDLYPFPCQPFS